MSRSGEISRPTRPPLPQLPERNFLHGRQSSGQHSGPQSVGSPSRLEHREPQSVGSSSRPEHREPQSVGSPSRPEHREPQSAISPNWPECGRVRSRRVPERPQFSNRQCGRRQRRPRFAGRQSGPELRQFSEHSGQERVRPQVSTSAEPCPSASSPTRHSQEPREAGPADSPQQPEEPPRQQMPTETLAVATSEARPGSPASPASRECRAETKASQQAANHVAQQRRKIASDRTCTVKAMDFINQLMSGRFNAAEGSQPPPPEPVQGVFKASSPCAEHADSNATGSAEDSGGYGGCNTCSELSTAALWDHELRQYVVHSREDDRNVQQSVVPGGGSTPQTQSGFGYRGGVLHPAYVLDLKLGHWACQLLPGQTGFGCPCCTWNSGRFEWECSYRQRSFHGVR